MGKISEATADEAPVIMRMATQVLLDTNIVIEHLRDDPTIAPLFDAIGRGALVPAVSTIMEFELLRYPEITDAHEIVILRLLNDFRIHSVGRKTAQIAALLYRRYRGKTNDLLIAATAIEHDIPLLTRNVRDFRRISELKLLKDLPSVLDDAL